MMTASPYWKSFIFNTSYNLTAAAYTKCARSWQDWNFIPEFNRFYYIRDGEGVIEIEGQRYYPQPGQLLLLPADVEQSFSAISEHTFLKYWCHFTARIGGINLFKLIRTPLFIEVNDPDTWTQRFEQLIALYRNGGWATVFRQHALLLDMIASYMDACEPSDLTLQLSPAIEKIARLLEHIDQHLADPITIDELAAISHYHPNHLIRVFKQFTGCSPIQYINVRRMEGAKYLLSSTNKSIADISAEVGMEAHYFSRMFKDTSGYSPSMYRRMTSPEAP